MVTVGRRVATGMLAVVGLGSVGGIVAAQQGRSESKRPRLAMTEAVACRKVEGYGQFVPLSEAVLTRDEKLLVYFEPIYYQIDRDAKGYRSHLTQDVRIRRRDDKKVIWGKEKIVDYDVKTQEPPAPIYLTNSIALKILGPGDYDLDIVLHDLLKEGPAVTQVLQFSVKPARVAAPAPDLDDRGGAPPDEKKAPPR